MILRQSDITCNSVKVMLNNSHYLISFKEDSVTTWCFCL